MIMTRHSQEWVAPSRISLACFIRRENSLSMSSAAWSLSLRSLWKVSPSITATSAVSQTLAEAVRGDSIRAAISPKYAPGPMSDRTFFTAPTVFSS